MAAEAHADDFITLRKETLAKMGFFVKQSDGTVVSQNRFRESLGRVGEDVLGEAWLAAIHPDDRESVSMLAEKLKNGIIPNSRLVYRISDGNNGWRWCMTLISVEQTPGEKKLWYIGLDQDITYIKQLQKEADDARENAERKAEEADTLRHAGAIIAASLNKEEMIARVVDQLRRLLPLEHCIVFERDGREIKSHCLGADEGESPVAFFTSGFGYEKVIECLRDGLPAAFTDPRTEDRRWLSVPLVIRGEPQGVFVVSRVDGELFDSTDVRRALAIADFLGVALNNGRLYEGMSMLATTDSLSGLFNRRAFFIEAQRILDEASIRDGSVASLVLDIDHFKAINDDFGHGTGDRAIQGIAAELHATLREIDTLGRYGGEEFVAILADVTNADAVMIAERVRTRIEALLITGIDRAITCSIGLAFLNFGDTEMQPTLEKLLNCADAALYEAKRGGRNRVEAVVVR